MAGRLKIISGIIYTVGDLVRYLPHRYEDRSNPRPLVSLTEPDQVVTVFGRIVQLTPRRTRNRRLTIVEGLLDDGTGALPVVWFNQPYLATTLKPGTRVWLHGPVRVGRGRWGLQLQSPEWEAEDPDGAPVHLGRIVPIYRRVGNLSGRRLRTLTPRALARVGALADPLAPRLPIDLGLPPLDQSVRHVHFPVQPADAGTVEVVEVIQKDVLVTGEWVGTLDGSVNATIRAQVSGYLVKQNYKEGDVVKKDQVLFEIDPREYRAALRRRQS